MTVLMNFVTRELPYSGSAGGSRRGISRLRGMGCYLKFVVRSQEFGAVKAVRNLGFATNYELPTTNSSLLLGPLRAVLGPALLAALHADRVQGAPDDVVAHPRQVLHAAAADEHQRV